MKLQSILRRALGACAQPEIASNSTSVNEDETIDASCLGDGCPPFRQHGAGCPPLAPHAKRSIRETQATTTDDIDNNTPAPVHHQCPASCSHLPANVRTPAPSPTTPSQLSFYLPSPGQQPCDQLSTPFRTTPPANLHPSMSIPLPTYAGLPRAGSGGGSGLGSSSPPPQRHGPSSRHGSAYWARGPSISLPQLQLHQPLPPPPPQQTQPAPDTQWGPSVHWLRATLAAGLASGLLAPDHLQVSPDLASPCASPRSIRHSNQRLPLHPHASGLDPVDASLAQGAGQGQQGLWEEGSWAPPLGRMAVSRTGSRVVRSCVLVRQLSLQPA
ncbi:hypothetical protein V8C86DRAFT_3136366 [Haematococcus lacustris]